MARKLKGFERVLDAPSLFAVAYGEIASSLYIALGIVAAQALGLTPLVLLSPARSSSSSRSPTRRARPRFPRRVARRRSSGGRSTTSPGSSRAGRSFSTS